MERARGLPVFSRVTALPADPCPGAPFRATLAVVRYITSIKKPAQLFTGGLSEIGVPDKRHGAAWVGIPDLSRRPNT